ncbi:MAG: hypothetical protein IJT73_00700 [Selenomonadaceae bacterium]|nr:hypothetical protein [Selenomonadaceae bacterium]
MSKLDQRAASVVKFLLKRQGYTVTTTEIAPPNDSCKVDFWVSNESKSFLAKVNFAKGFLTFKADEFNEYQTYLKAANLPLYIYFVDKISKTVYFQEISKIINGSHCRNNIIVAPRNTFKIWSKLSDEQLNFILDDTNDIDADAYRRFLNLNWRESAMEIQNKIENRAGNILKRLTRVHLPLVSDKFVIDTFQNSEGELFANYSQLGQICGYIHMKPVDSTYLDEFGFAARDSGIPFWFSKDTASKKGRKTFIKWDDVPRLLSAFITRCRNTQSSIRKLRGEKASNLLEFWNKTATKTGDNPTPSLFDSPQIDDALTFADLIEISNNFNVLKSDLPESQAIKTAVRIVQNYLNKNLFNFIKE